MDANANMTTAQLKAEETQRKKESKVMKEQERRDTVEAAWVPVLEILTEQTSYTPAMLEKAKGKKMEQRWSAMEELYDKLTSDILALNQGIEAALSPDSTMTDIDPNMAGWANDAGPAPAVMELGDELDAFLKSFEPSGEVAKPYREDLSAADESVDPTGLQPQQMDLQNSLQPPQTGYDQSQFQQADPRNDLPPQEPDLVWAEFLQTDFQSDTDSAD